MSKTRYTPAQREQALLKAQAIGPSAAGKELGLPAGTIAYWQNQARKKSPAESSAPTADMSPIESPSAQPLKPIPSAVIPIAPEPTSKPAAFERKVAKLYTPSERARALEYADKEGVTVAAQKFGISRFSLYAWRRRTELHAQGKIPDSPVVGSDENHAAARDLRILSEWKAHPGLGPSQVRNQLRRAGLKVSIHTVRCVLEENGYVTPKVRREPNHDQRYEAVRPNHLWHLDFLHRHIHKQKIYVLLILDDYSRFIVGGAIWDGERVAAVQETFLSSVNRHGRPEKAMSDGGSAFYAWKGIGEFTRLLEELEVDQLIAKTPNVNGKLEVLNANIQKELFNQETFFDLGEAQRRLAAWISFYNFRRTHHALGGLLVPADRYFGRADEVLAHIEAGRNPEGLGEPIAPGERHLDLFRITSHRGQVEIHLMGQRLILPALK